MLHDQCRSNGVQRERTRQFGRIELPPALLRPLAFIVKKFCRIDHETELTLCGGERRGALQTGLVQQVD
jgi:hypothetical protein